MFDDSSSHATQPKRPKQPKQDALGGSDDRVTPTGGGIADTQARNAGAPPNAGDGIQQPAPARVGADAQKTVITKRPPASPPAFRRAASPFEMGEALEGQELGHFQLEEFVGGGGMGAVFRATDTMLGRTVAVKVVSRDQTNEDTLRRFKNEAQSAARLDHPNIARVYYVGEDKGWNYIVFEYIEGVNVRDLVEHKGPLSLDDAISYTLQIADALEHASRRDVIHRDIKPSNILIMIDGHAKLVDMGLARLHQVETSSNDLTESGVTLGTFDYISPEQARDPRNTDVRSDLYSLGCTLYFMLTGQPPFPEGTVLQKLLNHSGVEPPDPRQYRLDLNEEVVAILHKMLAKLPSQRYQSPRELIGELILLADRLNLAAIRPGGTVWVTPGEHNSSLLERHLPWVIPVTLLLLAVFGLRWLDGANELTTIPQPRLSSTGGPVVLAQPADTDVATSGTATDEQSSGDQPTKSQPGGDSRAGDGVAPGEGPAVELEGGGATDSEIPGQVRPEPTASGSETKLASGSVAPAENSADAADPSGKTADDQEDPFGIPSKSDPPGNAKAATSTEGGTEIAASFPNVLVVTDDDIVADPNGVTVRSLRDAIETAMSWESLGEIRLRFNGVRYLHPLDIDVNRMPQHNLVIRAADGFAPVIVFQTSPDEESAGSDLSMIRVHGGHLTWIDTHFYWDRSASSSSGGNGALFLLNATDKVEFRRCSFTVRNVVSQGIGPAPKTSFFEFADASNIGELRSDGESQSIAAPTLWLEQCVARGQATLVHADRALPLLLSWDHGLFISTERLVEVGGTLVAPRWEHGRVTLFLRRLFAVADRGICLMKTSNAAPYQLGLAANCYDCLFTTRATNPATPLYELAGGTSLDNQAILVDVSGSNNFYKNTQIVLRIADRDGSGAVRAYSFNDLKSPQGETWFNEKSPQPGTMFSWEPNERTADRQTLLDYIPADNGGGPATRILNIVPDQLPRFPDVESATDVSPPTSAGEADPTTTGSAGRPVQR